MTQGGIVANVIMMLRTKAAGLAVVAVVALLIYLEVAPDSWENLNLDTTFGRLGESGMDAFDAVKRYIDEGHFVDELRKLLHPLPR